MASEIDKWNRRKCFPIDLGDGIQGYVQPMTFGQVRIGKAAAADDKTAWYLACCVCDEKSQPLISQNTDESTDAFIERASVFYGGLSGPTVAKAMEAIAKVTSPADQSVIEKNSPATETLVSQPS